MDQSTTPDFPTGFLWGSATSAHQVEGGNVNSDWWDFEHGPATAARESSGDGIDHLYRYEADFALLASLGHNAHRLSLEWSRIEPAPGEFSRGALAHHRRVLAALADAGLTGFVTLHHFTLPRWFAARGGWLGADAVASFGRYCARVAAELGDLMPYVCTINEPQMIALHGYLEGYHPPGITNPILWKRVGGVLLSAHRAAVRAVRDAAPRRPYPVAAVRHRNGIATEDDGERLDYLQTHLAALAHARDEGVDVRGYLHWSAFDNFEWSEGYGPKFGLIAVDHDNDFTRLPKPSAYAFAALARTGRLAALRESLRSRS